MTSITEQTETTPATATAEPKTNQKAHPGARRARVAPTKAKLGMKGTSGKKALKSPKNASAARDGSKTAKVLDLLKRPDGATLKELMKTTGWAAASIRGFVSGTIGKKMGLKVSRTKSEDGERNYSIKS